MQRHVLAHGCGIEASLCVCARLGALTSGFRRLHSSQWVWSSKPGAWGVYTASGEMQAAWTARVEMGEQHCVLRVERLTHCVQDDLGGCVPYVYGRFARSECAASKRHRHGTGRLCCATDSSWGKFACPEWLHETYVQGSCILCACSHRARGAPFSPRWTRPVIRIVEKEHHTALATSPWNQETESVVLIRAPSLGCHTNWVAP